MRAAQIDQGGNVINFAEVQGFSGEFIEPQNSVVGSVWNGNSFTNPAPTPAPVPEILSPSQFLRSLNYHLMRSQVDNYVSGSDQDTKDWYARATQFERHHPRVLKAILDLQLPDAQADAVWTYGATL